MEWSPLRVYPSPGELRIGVRVIPSAPRTKLRGIHGDRLKVAVAAPAEDNRANSELVEALADWLALNRTDVRVVKGHASRDKVIGFKDVDKARLMTLIREALLSAE